MGLWTKPPREIRKIVQRAKKSGAYVLRLSSEAAHWELLNVDEFSSTSFDVDDFIRRSDDLGKLTSYSDSGRLTVMPRPASYGPP